MARTNLSPMYTSVSGKLGNYIHRFTKYGTIVSNPSSVPTRPETLEQKITKTFFTIASKQWQELTDAHRADWGIYASVYFPKTKAGVGAGPSGQAVYNMAAWYRQAAGLVLPTSAPLEAPAASASNIAVAPATDPEELILTIEHSVSAVTGYRVLIETTPPILSAARQPQPGDFRAVKGIGVESLPALQASGQNYALTGIRYPLPSGARFGVRLTILNPTGIPSKSFVKVLNQSFV